MDTDRRQTDRWADRHIGQWTQTDRETERRTDVQANRHKDCLFCICQLMWFIWTAVIITTNTTTSVSLVKMRFTNRRSQTQQTERRRGQERGFMTTYPWCVCHKLCDCVNWVIYKPRMIWMLLLSCFWTGHFNDSYALVLNKSYSLLENWITLNATTLEILHWQWCACCTHSLWVCVCVTRLLFLI